MSRWRILEKMQPNLGCQKKKWEKASGRRRDEKSVVCRFSSYFPPFLFLSSLLLFCFRCGRESIKFGGCGRSGWCHYLLACLVASQPAHYHVGHRPIKRKCRNTHSEWLYIYRERKGREYSAGNIDRVIEFSFLKLSLLMRLLLLDVYYYICVHITHVFTNWLSRRLESALSMEMFVAIVGIW